MAKLIVGLGNFGKEYENTRHNIGFLVMEKLERIYSLTFKFEKRFNADLAISNINGEKVYFLKPMTYMNLSGEAIRKVIQYYNLEIADLLVIVDDLNLEVGAIRIRYKGSSGGHNGLKNIEANLESNNYKRIRVGIGSKGDLIQKDFVLSRFSKADLEILNNKFIIVSDAINDFINNIPFEKILTKYNGIF